MTESRTPKTYQRAAYESKRTAKTHLLSIIIVTYNDKLSLQKTLQSCEKVAAESSPASLEEIQCIVYDGVSTDGTYTLMKYASFPNIWIRDQDAGIYDAMNKACRVAAGKYVFFLNSGDTLNVDKFDFSIDLLRKNHEDMLYFNTKHTNRDGTIWMMKPQDSALIWMGNICSHQGCFIKLGTLIDIGCHNINFGIIADWMMMARVLKDFSSKRLEKLCFCITAPFGLSECYVTRTAQRYAAAKQLFPENDLLDSFYQLLLRHHKHKIPPFLLYKFITKLADALGENFSKVSRIMGGALEHCTEKSMDAGMLLDSAFKSVLQEHSETNASNLIAERYTYYSRSCDSLEHELDDSNLLFLISMPRAGSTLFQRLLMTSGAILSLSEPWILLKVFGSSMPDEISVHSSRLTDLAINVNQDCGGMTLQDLASRQKAICTEYYSRLAYSGEIGSWHNGCYLLDKTPRYILIFDEIYAMFPRAKYIFLNRPIADIVKSYIMTWCDGSTDRFLSDRLMQHDMHAMYPQFLSSLSKCRNSSNIISVSFGDLVSYTNKVLRSIEDFLILGDHTLSSDYSHLKDLSFRLGDPKSVNKFDRPTAKKALDAGSNDALETFAQTYVSRLGR